MSFAYFYGSLVYGIPAGRPYSSFEKLFFPFRIWIWILISMLFLVAAALLIVLKLMPQKNRNFLLGNVTKMPFFNMVNICLGGTVSFKDIPGRIFARTLLMIWLLATLVLRNAYQGKLFDNLRSNQRKLPYFYLNELYASDLDLYLYESFYQNIYDAIPTQSHR